jgi:hypothetical protein
MATGQSPKTVEKTLPEKVQDELNLWERNGITPNGLQLNIWQLDPMISTLAQILVDREVCTQDEMNEKYMTILLERLQSWRETILADLRKQSGIQVPQEKKIVDPFGRPFH